MMLVNNSTPCYHFINITEYHIVDISVCGASDFIGAVSALTAIVLILVAKAYKEFIYRLLLYMSMDGLISCLMTLAFRPAIDFNLQHEYKVAESVLLLFFTNYLVYLYFFLLLWLMLYLFLLAVFRVQLKKTKHETIGLVTVLVTPLTFIWVF